MGRRHGQALGGELRQLRRVLLAYLAQVSLYGGGLPLFGLLLFLARRFWPFLPPRLKQEMQGVAAGAQVGLGTVLLINVLDDLANSSPRCSSVAVGEGRTADGAYLMGRNLDYPVFTEAMVRLQTLFLMEPDQGLPLASVAWPGYIGVCTGLNKAGVGLAQHSAMSRQRTLQGVPAALRFRQALEEGDTVLGVAARVLKTPGTIGNNLALLSPDQAAVMELAARRGEVRRPEGGLLTATNHYQSPAMQALKGRFPPRPPFSPLSRYHFSEAYSQARNQRLRQLAGDGKLGVAEIQQILGDSQIANPGTVVSVVFAPGQRTLWVAGGQAPPVSQGPFTKVKLWD